MERTERFVSRPRTSAERRVFIECVVDDAGLRLELPVTPAGVLQLANAADVAVLVELLTSAHRRLVELEVAALPQGGADAGGEAAAHAVGALPRTGFGDGFGSG